MEPPPLQTARPTFNDAMVSVVVPAFNEQDNLESLHARLAATLRACAPRHEIIFVDDGSRDRTLEVIRKLAAADPKVKYLSFSRNFGHEPATTAGMDHARGDAVVLIDADLQDPPEIIAQMVERWKAGAQVVYAQRRTRAGETVLKKATSAIFYRALDSISEVRIPRDTGDFRLMDRAVVEAVRRCRENPRFVRGLVAWAGFRQEPLLYDRDARFAGETKYNFRKLLRLSFEAVTSFSLLPLRWAMQLGAAVVGVAFLLLLTNVVLHIARGETLGRGFDYLACALIFLAGLQLLMLGVMAEYLGMIHRNTLARPLYLVAEQRGFDTPAP